MPTRRNPAMTDKAARALFRDVGFDVESVSMIRSQDDEFMAIVCWPATDVATAVQLLTEPGNTAVEVTRIHIGRETYPGQPPTARVYVRWAR